MRKIICDHCGKDISGVSFSTLDTSDCYSYLQRHIGFGCDLCDDCWNERKKKHAELDMEFLHLSLGRNEADGD